MFNNVGGKIKGVISVVSGIMMLVSIITGIAVFIISRWEFGGFWAFIIGSAVAGVGILFSWLSNLVGYAFGQLVENSDRIREMMECSNTGNNVTQMTSFDIKAQQTKASGSYKSTNNTAVQENTTYITCPGCKESQPAGKTYCNICGTKLNTNIPSHTPAAPLEKIGNAAKTSGENDEFVSCPKCGELQPKGKNYCQLCGGKII